MKLHPALSHRLVLTAALVLTPAVTLAQATTPGQAAFSGGALFNTYCAVCHGGAAKGDGPLAASLKDKPKDLTIFAKTNGGTYPAELVSKIIDGREAVKGHGGKDMPVWGDAFKASIEVQNEQAVKARIDALVRYLGTIQVK